MNKEIAEKLIEVKEHITKIEELIKKVTGEEISTKYFLKYLEAKYKGIY